MYWCVARQPELLRADSGVFAERNLVCCSREIQLAILEKYVAGISVSDILWHRVCFHVLLGNQIYSEQIQREAGGQRGEIKYHHQEHTATNLSSNNKTRCVTGVAGA